MSAATLPKMSPPPRGAPSLNGCSGAPGVTRSPLSMEQGDLPRSVNKQTAGGRGESERAKPQNRGPGAGLLRVHERAGFCAAVACGAMFRVHRRGRRGVQAPGALGKGQRRGQGREGRRQGAQRAECRHGLGRLMASWASAETRPAGVGAAGGVDPARSHGVQSPLTH